MISIETTSLKSAVGITTLMSMKDVGPVTVSKILARYADFSSLLSASAEDLKPIMNEKQRRRIQDEPAALQSAFDLALRQADMADEYEVQMLSIFDDAYPRRLRDDPSPPMVLFVGGDLSDFEASVAFVGTRNPSEWGRGAANAMSGAMATAGWRVISGLASGIDAVSHRACLDAGTPTAAVIACGIDMIDPDRDRDRFNFLERVIDNGGLVVTEQLFGTPPSDNTLIRRNRIITGLSLATFFVQGEMQSGSMHSVKYALQQGRQVYVPAISSAQAQDTLNHAASNLARLSPQDLILLMDLQKGNLRAVLETMDTPTVADAVFGSRDYPRVLQELDDMLTKDIARQISTSADMKMAS
ncbi:DNA-processing protein DprA [Agrobacterium rubi]|nr:DNA-processing protein DprA [Agrobacterium rubi]NTF24748.1 DNA-processing protein DprA [Agrobacterium rubi]